MTKKMGLLYLTSVGCLILPNQLRQDILLVGLISCFFHLRKFLYGHQKNRLMRQCLNHLKKHTQATNTFYIPLNFFVKDRHPYQFRVPCSQATNIIM